MVGTNPTVLEQQVDFAFYIGIVIAEK